MNPEYDLKTKMNLYHTFQQAHGQSVFILSGLVISGEYKINLKVRKGFEVVGFSRLVYCLGLVLPLPSERMLFTHTGVTFS